MFTLNLIFLDSDSDLETYLDRPLLSVIKNQQNAPANTMTETNKKKSSQSDENVEIMTF